MTYYVIFNIYSGRWILWINVLHTYRESQKKVYIKRIIMLINYDYFYLKIVSKKGSKIKAKEITQNFLIWTNFFMHSP